MTYGRGVFWKESMRVLSSWVWGPRTIEVYHLPQVMSCTFHGVLLIMIDGQPVRQAVPAQTQSIWYTFLNDDTTTFIPTKGVYPSWHHFYNFHLAANKIFFEMFGHTYHFVSFGFNTLEFRFNCGNKDLITKSKDCTWKERMNTVIDYWLLNWKFISNLNSYHKFNLTKVWKNIHRTQANKIILWLNFYESRYDFNYFIKIMS